MNFLRRLALLFLSALSLALPALAQKQHQEITGKVMAAGKPMEGTTVAVLRASDSTIAKYATSGPDGIFETGQLKPGHYLLRISSIGYKTFLSKQYAIQENAAVVNAGTLELQMETQQLKEVVVTARKPMVEQKLDKTIVNIEGQPSNAGITALEVLEKSPGITVDKDGNISLKGKDGVMVLIDGKPTYMSNADLANYLRSLPSNQLESLEIMTNPPAKYEAAGNAGIINIRTKKNKAQGFNGTISVGAGMGVYPKANSSIGINYRKNKWNVFSNYSYNYNENFQDLYITRNFRDKNSLELTSVFDQVANMTRISNSHNAKLGADFYANKKTTLGVVFTGFSNDVANYNDNITNIYNAQGVLQTQTLATSDFDMSFKNLGANFNFRHQFDSTGRELSADVDFLRYDNGNRQFFNNYFFDKDGNKQKPDEFVYGDLPAIIDIYSAKADYVQPLKKDMKFEAGWKSSYVKTDNDAKYYILNNASGQWEVDITKTNHFIYTENINAAYFNVSKKFNKKWSAQAGVRAENTNAIGEQTTTDQNFKRHYTQVFPTLYVQYTANDKNSFVVNYGRRIQRPSYQDMNPFIYFLDRFTYQAGNPNLIPQSAHNIEFTHSYRGFLNTTLNYSRTTDLITQVFRQNDVTFTTFITPDNVATRNQIGMSVNAGMPVTKWWRANVFVNGFYNDYKGEINGGYVATSLWSWMTNIQNQFTFKKGWGAEVSGFYRSKMLEGVIESLPMGAINLAVSRKIMKDKGTLRLNFRDPFDLQYFRGQSKYQNIDIRFTNYWDNRVVNASFTWRFGKVLKSAPQRKTGGANDEQNRVNSGNQ